MKIKTQFIISMILFAFILAAVSISVIVTDYQVGQLSDQLRVVRNVQQDTNDLNYLSNAYLIYQQDYQHTLWESNYQTLSTDTAKLDPNTLPKARIDNIIFNQQQWQTIFTDMVSSLDNSSQTSASAELDKLQIFWSRMEVPNQSILADTSQLS